MASPGIEVRDGDRQPVFSFDQMLAYHGHGSPGGVAHAFKVLELGLALLEPGGLAERREIAIRTAFGGPGARDGFELVTRAVTDGRYEVDPALSRPELGRARERFVFHLKYRGRTAVLTLRDGFVTDEFIDLARADHRGDEDEARLARLKLEMAGLVMSTPAERVYEGEIV